MVQSLINELAIFVDPSKRLHWLFLTSTLAIALAYYRKTPWITLAKTLSSALTTPSSLLDFKVFILNRGLRSLVILPIEAWLTYEVLKSLISITTNMSLLGGSLPYPALVVLFTLFHFVIDDAMRFYQHRLMHKWSWLWEFHKVHHSATNLTPVTLYRIHPVELIVASLRRLLTALLTTTVMLTLSSQILTPAEILGVTALTFLFNFFGANLRHSEIPLRFGWLERIFISPFMHQIHHSNHKAHYDKNFGVSLSVWDQIHGSYLSPNTDALTFGLDSEERNHNMTLLSAVFSPMKFIMKPAFSWASGLRMTQTAALTILCLTLLGCDLSDKRTAAPPVNNFNEDYLASTVQKKGIDPIKSALLAQTAQLKNLSRVCTSEFSEDFSSEQMPDLWRKLEKQFKLTLQGYHQLEPSLWEVDFENSERNFLRQSIYSEKILDMCPLDQEVLSLQRLKADYTFPENDNYLFRGLDAAEYLLHSPLKHSCFDDPDLDDWNQISTSEKMRQRCAFVHLQATEMEADLQLQNHLLLQSLGNETPNRQIQKYYESLVIFVDRQLKDSRIAKPAGKKGCLRAPCPHTGEHRHSGLGLSAIQWNYEGLLKIFLAGHPASKPSLSEGFYGLLAQKDKEDLAVLILQRLLEAKAHASRHASKNFFEAAKGQTKESCDASTTENDAAPLCTAHKLAKVISDLFKVDLKAALLLENAKPSEGDGD